MHAARDEGGDLDAGRELDRSEESAVDRSFGDRFFGTPAELETAHVHDAGRDGGVVHGLTVAGIERERLLAQHVLAVSDGRQNGLGVCIGWGRDGHRVDVGQTQCFVEGRQGVFHTEVAGTGAGAFGIAAYDRDHLETRCLQRGHMDSTAERCADDDGAQRAFHQTPFGRSPMMPSAVS